MKFKVSKCENCKEEIRTLNLNRHYSRCIQGKRFVERKLVQYPKCKDYFKGGTSNGHFRRKCKGKGKQVKQEKSCKRCNRKITLSNMKKHEETCGKIHIIRQKNIYKKKDM